MSAEQIINTYDQMVAAGGDRITIFVNHWRGTRETYRDGWHVSRMKDGKWLVVDPSTKDDVYGLRGSNEFRRDRMGHWREQDARALELAIAWACEKYGKREFVRNRRGDYVECEVNEKYPIRKREKEEKKA